MFTSGLEYDVISAFKGLPAQWRSRTTNKEINEKWDGSGKQDQEQTLKGLTLLAWRAVILSYRWRWAIEDVKQGRALPDASIHLFTHSFNKQFLSIYDTLGYSEFREYEDN